MLEMSQHLHLTKNTLGIDQIIESIDDLLDGNLMEEKKRGAPKIDSYGKYDVAVIIEVHPVKDRSQTTVCVAHLSVGDLIKC